MANFLIAPPETWFVKDDWVFPITFADSTGTAEDMSGSTWTATLITESGSYTETAITGGNGSVNTSQAASGIITVTITDTLTTTLTPDMDSVDLPRSGSTSFNTRLVLIGTAGSITTTWVVIPIRVVRR